MEKLIDKVLYRAGENGYAHNRIPGIISCKNGVMIIYYECRRGFSDWSVSEIGMRRSTDGGKTWSDEEYIASGDGKNTVNNPVMIEQDGVIVFVWLENYKRAFCKTSRDNGVHWLGKREITNAYEEFRNEYPWTTAAAGPGHAILAGDRIVVPVWLCSNPANIFEHHPSVAATIYSDDWGKTWHRGEIIAPEGIPDPNEGCMAATPDGVLINLRHLSKNHHRLFAKSSDGISGWHDFKFDPELPDPICAAGMTYHGDTLYVTNCASEDDRVNLTLSAKRDGEQWSHLKINDLGGYSDVCVNEKTGNIFVVYESFGTKEIRICEIKP